MPITPSSGTSQALSRSLTRVSYFTQISKLDSLPLSPPGRSTWGPATSNSFGTARSLCLLLAPRLVRLQAKLYESWNMPWVPGQSPSWRIRFPLLISNQRDVLCIDASTARYKGGSSASGRCFSVEGGYIRVMGYPEDDASLHRAAPQEAHTPSASARSDKQELIEPRKHAGNAFHISAQSTSNFHRSIASPAGISKAKLISSSRWRLRKAAAKS